MPYIGKQLVRGQNRELDDISSSFNGATTTFNLTVAGDSVTPGSALQLFISVGGILQNPNTDFTVAGNQITFTSAPGSGLSFFGYLQGDAVDFNTPADGSVTTAKLGSNLTINVADGSAATPSIQFNGSGTDTGFYSPGADEVAVSTGGSGRLFIDSLGNVGIGTASPGVALHVDGDIRCDGVYGETDTNTSIQFPGSDVITFNEGGSEAARIDNSGRLLVGTSSARTTGKLQVNGGTGGGISVDSQASGITCFGFNSANANGPAAGFYRSRSATIGTNTIVQSSDTVGVLDFRAADGTNYIQTATVRCEVDGTPGANDMPGRLVFSTTADGASSPTERMRISNNGTIAVTQNVATPGKTMTLAKPYSNVIGDNSYIQFTGNGGAQTGVITRNGATSVAYTTTSDYRLKENVVLLSGAIDRLRQIPVHRFNFIAEPDVTVDGFLAHEAQAVVPECVTGEKDAVDDEGNPVYQGIDQSKLVPLLTAALQEALAKIETLEQRLNDAGIAQ